MSRRALTLFLISTGLGLAYWLTEPGPPWTVMIALGVGVSFPLLGWLGGLPGAALGVVAAAIPLVAFTAVNGTWGSPPDPPGGCDPSCGIGFLGSLILLLPPAALLALAGVAARTIVARARRPG
ncbi:hypothetical protein DVA67_028775 [Solirubrobacter sp. CPCC 204708]|uniref:Uncharacterized protein n=1 Tax=Solirubrobacter deserti TaxID=2282478 RepID=A0ABT4RUW8_9ACTN|nr:hypothetical protein [Solirubrobacter deserti]MBE2319993.1 hypothetical protein [Solirubrobacter deserti]MDA0142369.1 hypothetical protein [Solirubrobacter deserti]